MRKSYLKLQEVVLKGLLERKIRDAISEHESKALGEGRNSTQEKQIDVYY